MLTLIYLIVGVFLGWKEVKDNPKPLQEKDLGIFALFVFLWLPIYFMRWFKKLDFDLD